MSSTTNCTWTVVHSTFADVHCISLFPVVVKFVDELNVINYIVFCYINVHILFYVAAVHVEDIIFHMFQYIQKLRTEGPQEWVFEECKVINVVYSSTTLQTEQEDKLRACYI